MQHTVTGTQTYTYSQGSVWNNTTATSPSPSAAMLPAGPACQPCPDCGGLECLCRPRFFAGQLLTEQDLNRLENYIIAKNQLHNRYLVGHGVVCGLEVTCSPCANTIGVSAGYAIDPCGNDVIVCSPDTVDICKLINACTPTTAVNCAPYKDTTICKDATQEWILAIRYQETPSRGITPLTGSARCSCGASGSGSCSCGATSTKTCGCGSMLPAWSCCGQTIISTTPITTNLPRRGAPPACEPTVTCEAYRYEVFLAPTDTNPPLVGGDFLAQLKCCFQSIFPNGISVPTSPPTGQNNLQWSNFCCNLRQALMQYLVSRGGTDCEAIAKLRTMTCPAPESTNFLQELLTALTEEVIVLFEIFVGCFCSAALPPCLPPGDPRVPLAAVTVRTSDCTILKICDWTLLRKHVVTTRTLGYWFGWLPFAPLIREFLQFACCNLFNLPEQLGSFAPRTTGRAVQNAVPPALAGDATTAGATPDDQRTTFMNQPISFSTHPYQPSNPISEAVVANLAAGMQPVNVGDLMHALLDPVGSGTAESLKATPRAKILAEIARPLLSAFGPLLTAATSGLGQTGTGDAANAAAMAAMRAELDALRATVATQQSALDAMRQTPP
jgi:hypothetical protein